MEIGRVLKIFTNTIWAGIILILLFRFGLLLYNPAINVDTSSFLKITEPFYAFFHDTVEPMQNGEFIVDGSAVIGAFFVFGFAIITSKFFDIVDYEAIKPKIEDFIKVISWWLQFVLFSFFVLNIITQETNSPFSSMVFNTSLNIISPVRAVIPPIDYYGFHLELAAILVAFIFKLIEVALREGVEHFEFNHKSPIKDKMKPNDHNKVTQEQKEADAAAKGGNGPIPLEKPNLPPVNAQPTYQQPPPMPGTTSPQQMPNQGTPPNVPGAGQTNAPSNSPPTSASVQPPSTLRQAQGSGQALPQRSPLEPLPPGLETPPPQPSSPQPPAQPGRKPLPFNPFKQGNG